MRRLFRLPRLWRIRLAPYADSYDAPSWLMCWLGWHGSSCAFGVACKWGERRP
jgi:hypothetical protein